MDAPERAFGFTGNWRDYAPIAFTNLLLIIVTLGIYRFWATTRTRQYLWANTRFIDVPLEWTGQAKELLIGFLLVLVLLGTPLLCLQFGVQALIIRGHQGLGSLLFFVSFGALLYLGGLARYRALRYRLSRTYWHGIRGGSDDSGWHYGWSYMWKTTVGSFCLGLLIPWSMMSLWDERWNMLSFGPHRFEAAGDYKKTFGRFLLFYLIPIAVVILLMVGGALFVTTGSPQRASLGAAAGFALVIIAALFGVYLLLGVIGLAYYSKFFRVAVDGLSLSTLQFRFDARTKDWLLLLLGDALLVVFTLGIGWVFLSYRHWKFLVTHLDATGEIDLFELTQSRTREPKQGEGLLDAFDIGAF